MVDCDARRLTALAYFIFLGIGVAFSMAGVVTKGIAATFGVDTYIIGYIFTFFTAGYSLALAGNSLLLERVDIRRETLAAAAVAALGTAGATLWPDLRLLAASLFFYGLGLGALCSIAYHLMVNLHDEEVRAAKLNVLNFFYSAGSIAAPVLAGFALQQGARWQLVYQATLLLTLAVIWWVLSFRFRLRPRAAAAATCEDATAWQPAVYVVGATLLAYVLTEIIFTYWVVIYLMEKLAMDVVLASVGLSVFWVAMAGGRLAAGRLIGGMGIRRYLLASASLAFAAFIVLLTTDASPYVALALVGLIGLGCSGLYATLLSYGTSLTMRPSTRLTAFFLGVSAGGGILAFLLSSWLKQKFAVASSIALAAAFMGVVIMLTAVAVRERRA